MKKIILNAFLLAAILSTPSVHAQLLGKIGSVLSGMQKNSTTKTTTTDISESTANTGVKEVLANGLLKGVTSLNMKDAFYKTAYKIFLPEPFKTADNTLRKIGMSSIADSTELRINRAAETAVGAATPIFKNAISQMSVTDAVGLVTGGSNSITNFFKAKTYNTLVEAFKPTISTELTKNKSTAYYNQLVGTYNKIPFVKKADPSLDNYVATKAVDALFDQIGKEETNIRTNPAAQTTNILKSIFGKK